MKVSIMFRHIARMAAIAVFITPLWAHEFTLGDLEIIHPYAFETAPMAMSAGGFLTISNTGDTADRLIAVRADFPKVQVHETVVTDGVNQMLPVDGIDIPAGEAVALEPGGYHVMFMGLDGRQLMDGEEFPATLVFEKAGEIAVDFAVEKRSGDTGMKMDHSKMNMNEPSSN